MSEKNYIQILEDSLEKKIDVLRQLQVLCQEQTDILQDDASTPEAFEENILAAVEEIVAVVKADCYSQD